MVKIISDGEFFNVGDSLSCGQTFRFYPYKKGYIALAEDKCCYAYDENGRAVIETEKKNEEFFRNYFDLSRDYSQIVSRAIASRFEIIRRSATLGKGIRIFRQNATETLFSFMISQNNNIPRIKKSIEAICLALGDKRSFNGETFYSFPSPERLAEQDAEFYKKAGLGYRAEYVRRLATEIAEGFNPDDLQSLDTPSLRKKLCGIYGVGEKVSDCVSLFGYGRTDSFPVDTWIEKAYKEDFNGTLADRKKISAFFCDEFGNDGGFFQQYLFYYKRSLEKALRDKKT